MKKSISLLVSLFFFSTGIAQAAQFPDVPQIHFNQVAINHLSDSGILNGYPDGTFQPSKVVNRVEALKVILGASNINAETSEEEVSPFSDVPNDQWFTGYVIKAKQLGIVNGNPDGTFAPDSEVKRVAFIKMLLEANNFKKEKWENQSHFNDIPAESWYASYMNYAGKSGLIIPDSNGNLKPDQPITRGEMAEILYLMKIILNGKNTGFLVQQAELQMAQIEPLIAAKLAAFAKRASELAYDFTQQALATAPDNSVVLSAAKIAKAYDLLVEAYIAGVQDRNDDARTLAEQSKVKATEAWEANNDVQEIAAHIKARADEILGQL